jgi:hypothetical protein
VPAPFEASAKSKSESRTTFLKEESRMVNAATLYHLWGVKGVPIPLGLDLSKLSDILATEADRFAQKSKDET